MIEKLYTVEEVADLASVTGRTIRNYLKDGRLVGRKIGGQWRFPESEVQRLLSGGEPPTMQKAEKAEEEPAEDQKPTPSDKAEAPAATVKESKPAAPAAQAQPQPATQNNAETTASPAPLPPPQQKPDGAPTFEAPQGQPATGAQNVPQHHTIAGQTQTAQAEVQQSPFSAPIQNGDNAQEVQQPQPISPFAAPIRSDGGETLPQAQAQPQQAPQQAQAYPTYLASGGQRQEQEEPPAAQVQSQPAQPMYAQPQQPMQPAPYQQAGYTQTGYPPYTDAPYVSPQPMQPYAQPTPYPYQQPAAMPPQQMGDIPTMPDEYHFAPPYQEPAPYQQTAPQDPWSAAEISDVGRLVGQFISEVHDCSHGPQVCAVVDLHQPLSAARSTSETLAEIALQESDGNIICQSFVEYDERYHVARYTLFGTSSFLYRCIQLIG